MARAIHSRDPLGVHQPVAMTVTGEDGLDLRAPHPAERFVPVADAGVERIVRHEHQGRAPAEVAAESNHRRSSGANGRRNIRMRGPWSEGREEHPAGLKGKTVSAEDAG